MIVGRKKVLTWRGGGGCPNPVEILTISSLKWCNLVHFGGLIYVNDLACTFVQEYKVFEF